MTDLRRVQLVCGICGQVVPASGAAVPAAGGCRCRAQPTEAGKSPARRQTLLVRSRGLRAVAERARGGRR